MNDETQNQENGSPDDDWAAAMAEQTEAESKGGKAAEVEKAALDNLQADPDSDTGDEDLNLDVILDIPVTLAMEIGRTKISIRNLLHLNQGSVVELDRLAGEPLDVLVNGTLIAHGEVVVVNERFGIRLTDVVSPAERIKKLR